MDEKRLERIEDMLSNLITITGNINMKVEDLRQEMDLRFKEVDRRFDEIDQRFMEVDRRFDEIDQRFMEVDRRFNEIDQRFKEVDKRFTLISYDNEKRHYENTEQNEEILRQLNLLKSDQDYTWKKAVENEREIARLKEQK